MAGSGAGHTVATLDSQTQLLASAKRLVEVRFWAWRRGMQPLPPGS